MRRPDGKFRLSIFDVMVTIATLAVVLRGVIEVPRIVRSSIHRDTAASASKVTAEVAGRADRSRPDPVGYACDLLTLAGGASR